MTDERKAIGKNSFIVMAFTLISRLLGIVRIRLFGSIFGASSVADAINFSFNIPNNFRKLFSEGALSNAIVPQFARLREDEEKTQKLFSSFLGLQLILSVIILAFTILLTKPIVLLLSDFEQPLQNEIAIGLLPYFSLFLVFILISSYFSSVLQSRNSFLVQSVAPLLFSFAVIASLLLFSDDLGPYSMALGAASGGFLQMISTAIRLRSEGIRFKISFDFKSDDFREVTGRWIPAILASAISIVSTQAAFYFASGMGAGAVSAFSNSLIFWQTPYGIFFTAVSTVMLPIMSVSTGQKLSDTFLDGILRLSAFLIPSAAFLYFFRFDAVAVVLMTGNFTYENSILASRVLGIFLIGMPIAAYYSFAQRLCYCLSLQKTVLKASAAVCIVDIASSYALIKLGLGVQSLAVANLISNSSGLVVLGVCISKKIPSFDWSFLGKRMVRILAGCIPMIVFCIVIRSTGFDYWKSGSTAANLGIFCGLTAVSAALVLGFYRLLKIKLF